MRRLLSVSLQLRQPGVVLPSWCQHPASSNVQRIYSNRPFSSRAADTNGHSSRYCLDLVRTNDYENFLCTLLIRQPAARRSALAVRAFNAEVAKIASVVSDDKIGLMRLQFWHTAVRAIYANATAGASASSAPAVPDHPVCRELHRALRQNPHMQRLHLTRLIRARERPARQPFADMAALEQYAEESTSCTLYLLAAVAAGDPSGDTGNRNGLDVDHALSHLGKAQGIVNMLRAQALATRQSGVCVVPQRTQLEHGVSQERLVRCDKTDAGVRECVFDVASVAHRHLEKSRNLLDKIPVDARRLLLPAVAVGRYLERLRRADFHLADAQLLRRDSLLPLAYYWNNFRRKY